MLLVPNARARGSSLPGNMEVVNQDDIYRLRNFSKAGKKIVNRGDSVKARSRSSLASTCSRLVHYKYKSRDYLHIYFQKILTSSKNLNKILSDSQVLNSTVKFRFSEKATKICMAQFSQRTDFS